MREFSKVLLSGSTNGKFIQVTGTATGTANTIHTAITGTSSLDEIWLYASNTSATDVLLTLEWGAAGTANITTVTVTANSGRTPIIVGELLNNGCVVKAFAATGSVINIGGYVNRIS